MQKIPQAFKTCNHTKEKVYEIEEDNKFKCQKCSIVTCGRIKNKEGKDMMTGARNMPLQTLLQEFKPGTYWSESLQKEEQL